MLPLNSLIFFVLLDAIFFNCGTLLSFYIKFAGDIPDYNLQGYEGLYILISLSYFIGTFINGLYKKPENISYFNIVKNSIKAVLIAVIISMMFGYLFRAGRANAFPTSVFAISFFINTIILILIRIISKTLIINVQFYNKLVAFILNRIPECIIITVGLYLSFFIKFRTFNIPEYNFKSFGFAAFIVCLSYIVFIYKFLLYKYSREQSNFSVLYVMIKTTMASFITGGALLFVFREKIMGFPSSVFVISCIINYFPLAVWHIIIRRGIISEIEVDLNAEETSESTDKCECDMEVPPEKDGFTVYFRGLFSPSKFVESFKKYGSEFFGSSVILFFASWWMILVYMVFMPDYLKNYIIRTSNSPDFQRQPLFSNITFVSFAVAAGTFYILWQIFNHIFLKLSSKEKFSGLWAGGFYIYSLNLILFLIWIILSYYSNKYVSVCAACIVFLWILILNLKLVSGIFSISSLKSLCINVVSVLLSTGFTAGILFFMNR